VSQLIYHKCKFSNNEETVMNFRVRGSCCSL